MKGSNLRYCPFYLGLCFLSISPGDAVQPLLPTATFAGLRAAQADLGMKPTSPPKHPSELMKRLSGDPAICGWVEGSESKSAEDERRHI